MKYLSIIAALAALGFVATPALAVDCPPDAKGCKILVLTDEQANVLDQLISNTAVQGPYAQIKAVVDSFKDMIAKAPAGTVKKADAAPATPAAK